MVIRLRVKVCGDDQHDALRRALASVQTAGHARVLSVAMYPKVGHDWINTDLSTPMDASAIVDLLRQATPGYCYESEPTDVRTLRMHRLADA
jgi:hypothetical protein